MPTPTNRDYLKMWLVYSLPQHLVSRFIFLVTRIKSPWKNPFVRWFIKRFKVDMSEALHQDINAYASFNEFFTRELKPGLRHFDKAPNILSSPVDGTISEVAAISEDRIIQAKHINYLLLQLIGGNQQHAQAFQNGNFATIYLSPRDYHRIHMPIDGTLTDMIYVPGRLYSVAPFTVNTLPGIFARNERVVCLFDTAQGRLAVILVGAINVAAIETVWHGLVTPPHRNRIQHYNYRDKNIQLNKGDELGRFNMGSTVILLSNEKLQWEALQAGQSIKLGQTLGHYHL
ncbi:MAG: phosphatidylserine decarboxylase [Gammaproteobacteria bacterium]|nr:phosphatidylserine decarboxylase [Gammaproteobacteria bacterium]